MGMQTKRILIVDDDVAFTRMVKLNLEQHGGYEVREENSAANALAAAHVFKPDIFLLDIIMPGMDGTELASRIRGDRILARTPVVFLTATITPDEARARNLENDGMYFLTKPVQLQDLLKVIEDHTCLPPEAAGPKA